LKNIIFSGKIPTKKIRKGKVGPRPKPDQRAKNPRRAFISQAFNHLNNGDSLPFNITANH